MADRVFEIRAEERCQFAHEVVEDPRDKLVHVLASRERGAPWVTPTVHVYDEDQDEHDGEPQGLNRADAVSLSTPVALLLRDQAYERLREVLPANECLPVRGDRGDPFVLVVPEVLPNVSTNPARRFW